jgi:hypothetical protein
MNHRRSGAAIAVSFALLATASAADASEVYDYRIHHATYGTIGTYTNIVDRDGDDTDVHTELHIAVRILGLVVWRQDATRTEHWKQKRFVSFDGMTITNGKRLKLLGEARDDAFAITTPSGTMLAPANVHPSNPWSAMVLETNFVMSTSTGKVTEVDVIDGGIKPVELDGKTFQLHQFEIVGDKRRFVWLDGQMVPVAFRTEVRGAAVDFILTSQHAVNAALRPCSHSETASCSEFDLRQSLREQPCSAAVLN